MKMKMTNMTLYSDKIATLMAKTSGKISSDVVKDLKRTAPADDTTKEKARYIYNRTGKKAWIKDDIESRLYWEVDNRTIVKNNTVTREITNENPAVISLALGFIHMLDAEPVERTPDGIYSEQDPKGEYAINSLIRAFEKNRIKEIKKI